MQPTSIECPFCNPVTGDIVLRNDLCYAIRDRNPVTRGHMLVIPFRHVATYFETTYGEKVAIMDLIEKVRDLVEREFKPDGYNLGVNIGEPAGQTVMHAHYHFIPRYRGDTKAPAGGVRNILAEPCA